MFVNLHPKKMSFLSFTISSLFFWRKKNPPPPPTFKKTKKSFRGKKTNFFSLSLDPSFVTNAVVASPCTTCYRYNPTDLVAAFLVSGALSWCHSGSQAAFQSSLWNNPDPGPNPFKLFSFYSAVSSVAPPRGTYLRTHSRDWKRWG